MAKLDLNFGPRKHLPDAMGDLYPRKRHKPYKSHGDLISILWEISSSGRLARIFSILDIYLKMGWQGAFTPLVAMGSDSMFNHWAHSLLVNLST